eukprot:10555973-Heterocapsa_arctica.AAC.1
MFFGPGRKQKAEEPAKEPAGSSGRKRTGVDDIHRENKKASPQDRKEEEARGLAQGGGNRTEGAGSAPKGGDSTELKPQEDVDGNWEGIQGRAGSSKDA